MKDSLTFQPCTIGPLQACRCCAFSRDAHDACAARCWHPGVVLGRGPQPCEQARVDSTICGPEATYWQSVNDTHAARPPGALPC